MTIEDREFDTQHYVYVEGSAPMMDGEAIANAMGMAFGSAFKGIETHAMTAQSAPICVYADMPGAEMTFRAGFLVSSEDAAKASGDLTKLAADTGTQERVAEAANALDEIECVMFRNFDKMVNQVRNHPHLPQQYSSHALSTHSLVSETPRRRNE